MSEEERAAVSFTKSTIISISVIWLQYPHTSDRFSVIRESLVASARNYKLRICFYTKNSKHVHHIWILEYMFEYLRLRKLVKWSCYNVIMPWLFKTFLLASSPPSLLLSSLCRQLLCNTACRRRGASPRSPLEGRGSGCFQMATRMQKASRRGVSIITRTEQAYYSVE